MRWFWLLLTLLCACDPTRTQLTNMGALGVSVDAGQPQVDQTFDFGSVRLGTSRVVTVSVTNIGKDALTVTRTSLLAADTGAYFVRGTGGKLEPSAARTFDVTFAPVRAGEQTARLAFEHDAAAPAAVLSITGTGAP